jgi:hypothetical protein
MPANMNQEEQLQAISKHIKSIGDPKTLQKIYGALDDPERTFDTSGTIQIGDKFPDFRMPNAVGEEVISSELLKQGHLLITFYRGEWCK